MAIYIARQTDLTAITPTAHTFTVTIYRPDPLFPDLPAISIATLTLAKDPAETWPAFQTRAYNEIAAAIATYEQAQNLHAQAQTWLQTQEWTT